MEQIESFSINESNIFAIDDDRSSIFSNRPPTPIALIASDAIEQIILTINSMLSDYLCKMRQMGMSQFYNEHIRPASIIDAIVRAYLTLYRCVGQDLFVSENYQLRLPNDILSSIWINAEQRWDSFIFALDHSMHYRNIDHVTINIIGTEIGDDISIIDSNGNQQLLTSLINDHKCTYTAFILLVALNAPSTSILLKQLDDRRRHLHNSSTVDNCQTILVTAASYSIAHKWMMEQQQQQHNCTQLPIVSDYRADFRHRCNFAPSVRGSSSIQIARLVASDLFTNRNALPQSQHVPVLSITEDAHQLGGIIVCDRNGRICAEYRSTGVYDMPNIHSILSHLTVNSQSSNGLQSTSSMIELRLLPDRTAIKGVNDVIKSMLFDKTRCATSGSSQSEKQRKILKKQSASMQNTLSQCITSKACTIL